MDFNELCTREAHEEGAEMRVIGPDGKLTDFYITLVGVDSAKWRNIKKNLEYKALMSSIENKKADIDTAQTIAEATIGWRGLKDEKKEVPFSVKTAKKLYQNAPYICDQADIFIAKRVNFIKASQKG